MVKKKEKEKVLWQKKGFCSMLCCHAIYFKVFLQQKKLIWAYERLFKLKT